MRNTCLGCANYCRKETVVVGTDADGNIITKEVPHHCADKKRQRYFNSWWKRYGNCVRENIPHDPVCYVLPDFLKDIDACIAKCNEILNKNEHK